MNLERLLLMNLPIFLSSDNNYAPFVATTIASICDNTKSFCDFYVLDGGITEENKEKIKSLKSNFKNFDIEFITINFEKEFNFIKYKNLCSHVSATTYYRFLAPSILPDCPKILYLDVDIIALGDIVLLYNQDIGEFPLGAVQDFYSDDILSVKKRMNMNLNSPYFNAGVLLMDTIKWKKFDLTDKLFETYMKYENMLTLADQDVLNKYFENNYYVLDTKYNVMEFNDEIVLRHFGGAIKPNQADFHFDVQTRRPVKTHNCESFWKYAAFTPYLGEFKRDKEKFLKSNLLFSRINMLVQKGKI